MYTWIGGTRSDWRGQGHFRALTEQQESWAIENEFDEIVVKTKNKFYEMRGTLDHLRFEVIKYERHESDNAESKVYLSKRILPEMLAHHRSRRTVMQIPQEARPADAVSDRVIDRVLEPHEVPRRPRD
jgi:hypothetical protein